ARRLSSCAGGGSGGSAPTVSVPDSPPRMSVPTRPVSSAKTGPAHAPIKMQIAAPENQLTNARATPKTPNWASLPVTTPGIQMLADAAYPIIAMPVITPVGTSPRARTSPSSRNHAVNHHSPAVTTSDTMAKRANPSPPPRAPRRPPSRASPTNTTSSQTAPRQYAPTP